MNYHAKLNYSSDNCHYWWDHSKESIINDLLIPFVNGQVIPINSGEKKSMLNMKNTTLLNIYRTVHQLEETAENEDVTDLIDKEEFDKYDCTEEIIGEYKQELRFPFMSELERKFSQVKNEVFVIMKFGCKDLDSAYEGVIEPVVKEFNLTPIRSDKIKDSGKITDQIMDSIASSKYIIADLTGERPNTYYEAGFAHALGKELILSIKKSEKIHFDLGGHRFIQWETESELRKELKARFSSLTEKNR